jgi:hypothetical protein
MHVTKAEAKKSSIEIANYIQSFCATHFNDACSETSFYEGHVRFVSITFNPTKVSLNDSLGLGRGRCFYQNIIDERQGGFVALQTKPISKLQKLAKDLNINDAEQLPKLDLIFAILDHSNATEPILQRPLVVPHPRPTPIKVAEHLHRTIAKACVGGNYHRKIKYQPLMFAFTDFEGTRTGASVDPLHSAWPHVHGLLLVRPDHLSKFETFERQLIECFHYKEWGRQLASLRKLESTRPLTADEQARRLNLQKLTRSPPSYRLSGDLDVIHDLVMEPYRCDHPLAELVGYCKKGVDQLPTQYIQHDHDWRESVWVGANDLWHVFPHQLSGQWI